ncbi:MAG: hypothetical protein NUV37_01090 [Nanoarchaeota archaeon]|nr:hypothetical protein [Nanoarchaeota archaeon]
MKFGGVILLFLGVVLFSSLVSAVGSCVDSDTIFKLYDASYSSHAGTYLSPYNYDVCYSDFFGAYTGNTTAVHNCYGKDNIVWLSGTTNAHASNSSSSVYNTSVCYGNLDCVVDTTSSLTCYDTSRTVIARMSSNPGTLGASNLSYSNKICCKKTYDGDQYRWEGSSGTTITQARVGDTVYASAQDYDGTADSTFDIYEYDPTIFDVDETIFSNAQGSAFGTKWRYNWTILKSDIIDSGTDDYDDFRFWINQEESKDLNITFCGDGMEQPAFGEECDIPNDVCTSGYGQSCSFCNSTCQEDYVDTTYCGDGQVYDGIEECDLGANNSNTCTPETGGICDYCIKDGANNCTWGTINDNDPYWTDLSGEPIATSSIGSLVMLWYNNGGGRGFTSFDVFEEDPLFDDSVTTILGEDGTGDYDGDFIGFWLITQGDVDKGGEEENYAFKFSIDGKDSANSLDIVPGGVDQPIDLKIISPDCGEIFYMGDEVTIEFEVNDPDDLVNVILTINENPVTEIPDETNALGGTRRYNYTFSESGTIPIRVVASNDDEMASVVSNVIVVNPAISADYVAACISEPKNFERINSDFASFDASNSIAISYDGSSITTHSLSDMSFNWVFSDGRANPYSSGGNPLAYKFQKYFQSSGDNWAKLDIGL